MAASALSKRLHAEMKARDWSYQDLANFLERSKSQVHGWANDAGDVTLDTVRHIAKKLDCKLIELIEAKAS